MIDRKKMKSFAKMQLKGRWKLPVLITLISIIVSFLFIIPKWISFPFFDYFEALKNNDMVLLSNIYTDFTKANNQSILVALIECVLNSVITYASINIFVKMSLAPEKLGFNDYLKGFNYWPKAIGTTLWIGLWITLWALLIFPLMFVGGIVIGASKAASLISGGSVDDFAATIQGPVEHLTLFCLIILFIIIIIKSLQYCFTWYIVVEHENCSPIKALSLSKKLTKGHKWEIFKVHLSFIGWIILSLVTLSLAELYVSPYRTMTMINCYHSILKDALQANIVHPEDFE